jgi:hypothetical protein
MQRRRSMPHLFPRNRYEHRAGLRLSGLGEAEKPNFRDRCSLKWPVRGQAMGDRCSLKWPVRGQAMGDRCSLKWPVWGQAMGRCDPNRARDLSRGLSHGRFRGRFRGLSRSMSRGLPVVCPWSVPRQTTQ